MRFIIALFFLLILSYFADAVFWFAADRLSYVLSANSMLGFIFLSLTSILIKTVNISDTDISECTKEFSRKP